MRNINSRKLHAGLVALAAFSSVLVTGCSSEGIVDAPEKEQVPFEVTASMSATARAATDLHSGQYFAAGEKVRILVQTNSMPTSELIDDIYTFSDGVGHLTGSTSHYLPSTVTTANVLGLYPSTITGLTGRNSGIQLSFTVQSNQSEDSGYNDSDLMAAVGSVTYENPQVALTFKHLLTKLVFNLTYTNESETIKAEDAEVSLLNIYPTAKCTALLSDLPEAVSADASSTPTTIIAKEALKKSTSVAVIIPQQDIASTADFLSITLDGRTFTGSLPADTKFKGGCIYTYDVTIQDSNFYVSQASIGTWGTDETTAGGSITVVE